jgi:hypothetical protein
LAIGLARAAERKDQDVWSSLALGTKHRGNGILSAVNFIKRVNTKVGSL